MLLVNIDYIPGRELEVLGIAKGTVVQSDPADLCKRRKGLAAVSQIL